jgi:hypothetical protein
MTNLDPTAWDGAKLAQTYLGKYPDIETGHKMFLDSLHNPMYFEQFLSSEKLMRVAQTIPQARDADEFFSILVDVLNIFAKKIFFPAACGEWGLLKMKELFYRKKGQIRRDMAEDVIFNLFIDNKIEENWPLIQSAAKFNSFSIKDFSGRKLWILPRPIPASSP